MTGTLLNVIGIMLGGLAGLIARRNLGPTVQQQARLLFTALTLACAAWLVWQGLSAPFGHTLKQLLIAAVAVPLGSLAGHLLGLQRELTRLARWAARTSPSGTAAPADSTTFATQAVAFAGNPLGIVGALMEGWTGEWRPLALKAGLDAFAALGFAAAGSRTVMLAILPLVAVQGTVGLLAGAAAARHPDPAIAASLRVTAGLLVLVMAPVIFGWQRVPLANYLPALAIAPALTVWWR